MFKTLAILFILMGFAGIGHHYWICGRLWDKGQLLGLHHEPLIAICFCIGIVLLGKESGVRKCEYE